jgi:endoglucanase
MATVLDAALAVVAGGDEAMRNQKAWAAGAALMTLAACRGARASDDGRACPPEAMIENAEDGDGRLLLHDGRTGYVYTYADSEGSTVNPAGDGAFKPALGGANGTAYALRFSGKTADVKDPNRVVLGGLGMDLTDKRERYDASRYGGLAFFARRGKDSTERVRLLVRDENTDPEGGICTVCWNDFGEDLALDEDWKRFVVPFSKLEQQPGWGLPRPRALQSRSVFSLAFHVTEKGRPFDIWVDELAFIDCAERGLPERAAVSDP